MHLTPAQLLVVKAAIAAETAPAFVAFRNAGDKTSMATWFSSPTTPAFIVWKTTVSIGTIGDNFVGTELANRSTADNSRLQVIAAFSTAGVNPSLADRRAFFDDIFSGAGGVLTRVKLLALWKRTALRIERLFATGTGSDAVPGLLVYEGDIDSGHINDALEAT